MDLRTEHSVEDRASILLLSNNCLIHILSFLNVGELIVIEKVCKRFAAAAQHMYSSCKILDFSNEDFKKQITVKEATVIASRVGSSIETLKMKTETFQIHGHHSYRIPKFIEHFKNLKSIDLHGFNFKNEDEYESEDEDYLTVEEVEEYIEFLAVAFRNVAAAKFDWCTLSDENLIDLFNTNQIEILELPRCLFLKGRFLEKFPNIREINLELCPYIDPQLFRQFCKDHPSLQSLNIIDCRWIDRFCFQSIATLQNLETIRMNDKYLDIWLEDHLILADLPRLRHLEINCTNEDLEDPEMIPDMFLLKISTHNRLESLDITKKTITSHTEKALRNFTNLRELNLNQTTNCRDSTLESLSNTLEHLEISSTDVTCNGLNLLIQRCSSLKLLNVEGCSDINGDFISQILRHTKGRSHSLKLIVKENHIPKQTHSLRS